MRDTLGESLRSLKWTRIRKNRMSAVLLVLSLVVSVNVFWGLRKPGLTLAGDAACGILEHTHDEACDTQNCICDLPEEEHTHEDACFEWNRICELEEHVHCTECYSDETADVETMLDWQEMFAGYPYTGNLREDLVGIAKTQVGYAESIRNFEIGEDGVRRGYTRYGAWYGTPYRDWSAMFVSFCLSYAGADPETTPGNTGAAAMAETWRSLGHYGSPGEYTPTCGDLVFLADNTVGIVAEVQSTTCYMIRGDVGDAVCGEVIALADGAIVGWGITEPVELPPEEPVVQSPEKPVEEPAEEEPEEESEEAPIEEPEKSEEGTEIPEDVDLLDISDGPAVFLFAGSQAQPQMRRYSLRMTPAPVEETQEPPTDLIAYLTARKGTYFFTLLDLNNTELPKDANGNYVVTGETGYKLTLSITNPEGFAPGTYQYQLPGGLMVNGGKGSFILTDDTNVGDWEVSDEGLITIVFNEHMNSRSDITISATMGIMFPVQEDPLDFDGKIMVTIEKPPEEEHPTALNKWGQQGSDADETRPDPSKLYWMIEILGKKDSKIPGSVLTDKIVSGEHRYTDEDRAAGLHFGISETDPETGVALDWHEFDVYPGDPNLNWTETGWTYTIPEKVTCIYCGEITLGNDGWMYWIDYSSTPNPTNVVGSLAYMNYVTIDDQEANGWASFMHGEASANIVKTGTFQGDANGGAFLWEFDVTIPGIRAGERADYSWFVMDYLRLWENSSGIIGYLTNDANQATVTATNQGKTVVVPHVKYATEADQFAWCNPWSADQNGIYYGRQLDLLNRCNCTKDTCCFWGGTSCGTKYWYQGLDGKWHNDGYCQCWAVEGETTFTFTYKTKALPLIDAYGGFGYDVHNEAVLYQTVQLPDGNWGGVSVADAQSQQPIPGVFEKKLTQDFDGYTANYLITVNEAKIALTNGSPLLIHDVMSETLAYISGSLVITTEDVNGNREKTPTGR